MKNILLVSNIVLFILVGILYYLYFNGSKKGSSQKAPVSVASPATGMTNVAYIDLDSLQSNYTYYKIIKADFEKQQEAANNQITALQKKYQARAIELQQKGPTMNQQEQESAMQEMNKMQQDLQEKKQGLDNGLYNSNSKMKEDILFRIQSFLKDYNKDRKYSYIFSYEPGFMFYKDSTLDITPDVIDGLNELYTQNKK